MINEYVLPGATVFPEGITEDPDGATFYVSSAREGTIFRGHKDAPQLEVWQPSNVDGRTQALGMAVDRRGRLLVCGGSTGHLFAYDTKTGDLIAKRTVPSPTALLNDVCVSGGYAYVTDSERPVVWRFSITDDVGLPEEWIDLTAFGASAGDLHYLNGIVAAEEGAVILAVAQGTGVLWRVDVATRTATAVDVGGATINGDGMVFIGDVLYICDNSDEPDGTVRYWLTALRPTDDAYVAPLVGRWERSGADTPTTLAYLDGRLYAVNSQFWADRTGAAAPPFTVSAFTPPLA